MEAPRRALDGMEPAVSTSSRIELAAGQITPSGDTLRVELIKPAGSPAGSVDHLAGRAERHQHRSERARERSGLGCTRHGRSASTTRKALSFEGGPQAGLSLRCIESKANFAAGLLNLSPERRGQADDRRILVFRDDLSSSLFQNPVRELMTWLRRRSRDERFRAK